jgi:Putative DNA-binding domain
MWPERPAASLAEIQRRFYTLVTAADAVGKTLAARGQTLRDLEAMVVGDARLDAAARLDVYANMYFFRLLDVLRDAYPKLTAVVGDAAFHNLVTEYLQASPPAHPSIALAGDRLPQFLASHALAEVRPWLVPLAELERAYTEVFDGPDAETLSLDDVRALPPTRLTALPLSLVPCHRLLHHGFAIDPSWRALEQAGEVVPPAPRPEDVLVWRQGVEVHHRPTGAGESALLALAARGTTVQHLCENIDARSIDDGAQKVFHLLARWLADGLVAQPEG